MNKTAQETPPEQRVYTPASIEEAYRNFPAEGRTIKIAYQQEYLGSEGRGRKRIRIAKVYQKEEDLFTVEFIPENKPGCRGRYKQSFLFVDLIAGKVKMWEVGG